MTVSRLLAAVGGLALVAAAGGASAQDWQGFYVGGFAGYSDMKSEGNETLLFDTNQDGTFGDTVNTSAVPPANAFSPGFCDGSPNGPSAATGCSDDKNGGGEIGLRAGYDWNMGSLVFGVVADISKPDGEDTVTGFSTTPANYSFDRSIDYLVGIRGRLGVQTGRFLPYVTAGYAQANLISAFSTSNAANSFAPSGDETDADGWQAGAGVETMVTDRISVGLEYMYTSLEDDGHVLRVGPGTAPATNPFLIVNPTGTDLTRSNNDVELHTFRLTAALRF